MPSANRRMTPACVILVLVAAAACSAAPTPLGTEVALTSGSVRGELTGDVHVYRGIPYAAPPVGDLRWAPPQPVSAWEGTRDATAFGPNCVQPTLPISLYAPTERPESEDCLVVNVWSAAQSADERRPVMVWIHGGALIYGSGSDYDGAPLARKGVVVVTINYRLGPFGFFAHPALSAASAHGVSGNQGFLDQIAALRWVRDNIAAFGGDPTRVTIFGESAGSLSVSALMASPLAAGLFQGAIGESGSVLANGLPLRGSSAWGLSGEALGEELAHALGVGATDALGELRSVPAEKLLDTWAANPVQADYFRLVVIDGEVFPTAPAEIFAAGRHNDVPLLLGSNADEGTALAPGFAPGALTSKSGYEAWIRDRLGAQSSTALELYPAATSADVFRAMADLFTDDVFTWAMQAWAEGAERGPAPVYLYYFSRVPPGEETRALGAYHASEIPYVFGWDAALGGAPFDAVDRTVSEAMSDAWVRFAATGDPNGGTLPPWQPYHGPAGSYMEFGDQIRAGTGLRSQKVAFWRAYYAGGGLPPIASGD